MSSKTRHDKRKNGYVPHQREENSRRPKGSGEIRNGTFVYEGDITVDELARRLGLKPAEIVKSLFLKGKLVNINSILDDDLIAEICVENNFDFERKVVADPADFTTTAEDDPSLLVPRPPIITVMGHVDHGKTTLIDKIRHSNVVQGEAGGITQSIGAYQKEIKGKKITILDTPGHEAFTGMRARGAKIGDIAILVVAADDGVMPQTREAIDHAKAAKLPIVVAINKCDKPGSNPDRVKTELAGLGLTPEEWGGDTITVPISAKTGQGVDDLLENVLTLAELLELKANPSRPAEGTVIEAGLDKREGPKATLMVQNGTLHVGDYLVVGENYCKVKRMTNEYGKSLKSAGPSTPVSVLGIAGVPVAGDPFRCFPDEKTARTIAAERAKKLQAKMSAQGTTLTNVADFLKQSSGEDHVLNIVVKADSQGMADAIKESLEKLSVTPEADDQSTPEEMAPITVHLVRCATGEVTEGDVILAEASHGLIITFNTKVSTLAQEAAKNKKIEIRSYSIIYRLTEDVEKALRGMLKPVYREVIYGHAEVKMLFKSSKAGIIAGCLVTDGKIVNNSNVRIIRGKEVVETTKLTSLKHVKDDIREANANTECGLTVASTFKFDEGDVIESYGLEEVVRNG